MKKKEYISVKEGVKVFSDLDLPITAWTLRTILAQPDSPIKSIRVDLARTQQGRIHIERDSLIKYAQTLAKQ